MEVEIDKYKKRVLYVDLHSQYGDAAYYLTDTPGPSNLAEIVSQPYMNSVKGKYDRFC